MVHGGFATGKELDHLIVVGLVGEEFLGYCFLGLVFAVVAWVSYGLHGA